MKKIINIILIALHLTMVMPVDEVLAAEYRLKASAILSGRKVEIQGYKLIQAAVGEPAAGKVSNDGHIASIGYVRSTAASH